MPKPRNLTDEQARAVATHVKEQRPNIYHDDDWEGEVALAIESLDLDDGNGMVVVPTAEDLRYTWWLISNAQLSLQVTLPTEQEWRRAEKQRIIAWLDARKEARRA